MSSSEITNNEDKESDSNEFYCTRCVLNPVCAKK
jgi:hypothetical protein